MKTSAPNIALITGISGQDGSYLAQLLLRKGYRVIGTTRNSKNNFPMLNFLKDSGVEMVSWDMLNEELIVKILTTYRPSEIYNFAAYSSGAGMFDHPVDIGEVNGLAVARILEAIRKVDASIRFCQASSSELFGEAQTSPQSEETAFCPRNPYGAAKLYAHQLTRIYREHYEIFACAAILYNHESARRGLGFVTRKITHTASKIKLGLASELRLQNLDGVRDWGYAIDYVYAMWLMLQQVEAQDYVIASGETHSVREVCSIAFSYLNLNYLDYVKTDINQRKRNEIIPLVGNSKKAKRELGWQPSITFEEMVHEMVDADMMSLSNAS